MYARVSTFQAKPGKLAEAATLLNDEAIRMALQQKGIRGVLGLTDPVNERLIAISLWETEQQRNATSETSSYYQEIVRRVAEVTQGPPQVENYEAHFVIELKEGATTARRTLGRIQHGKAQTFREILRGSVTADALQQTGIKGMLQLLDASGRNVAVLSFWETEEAMLASETGGYYRAQSMKFADILDGEPVREVFGIEIQKLVLAQVR